jgi:opacity protein-like surface antigen
VKNTLFLRGVCLAAITLPVPGSTQEGSPTGVRLTFGISERLEISDNRALEVPSPGETYTSETGLSFGAITENRSSSLSFDLSAALRLTGGPGSGVGDTADLANPAAVLSYTRRSADARLDLRARLDQTDIGFARQFEDFINEDGTISLPGDFNDLFGTGTRQSSDVSATLVLRETAPLGFTLTGGLGEIAYFDASDPELRDNTNARAGATVRLDLTEVTSASIGLDYRMSEEDGGSRTETLGLDAGLAFARPNGALSFDLGSTDSEDGNRLSFRVGRDGVTLPRGTLHAGFGVTRDAEGELNFTGDLSWQQDLPRGSLSASLSQNVTSDNTDNSEELQTIAAVRWAHEINNLSSLSLDMAYVQSSDTGDDSSVTTSSIVATYGYALTENWALDLGYRFRQRDDSATGTASENAMFLTLGRVIEIRP